MSSWVKKNYTAIFAIFMSLYVFQLTEARAQSGSDAQAARSVITGQLEAFLSGDFAQAYSYASPNIKRLFPSQDQFMTMVKRGYLPVLRPGNYAYGETQQIDGTRIRQEVLIQAPGGEDWTATYFMALQGDGTWKVDGVQLKKGAAGMI